METRPSGRADDLVCSSGQAVLANSIHVSMGVVEPHSLLPTGLLSGNPAHAVATRSSLYPENQRSASLVVPVLPMMSSRPSSFRIFRPVPLLIVSFRMLLTINDTRGSITGAASPSFRRPISPKSKLMLPASLMELTDSIK